jgi:hypothetical protein
MTDLFEQRLREAARSLPVPRAPERVIENVIARRAAGDRILLPTAASRQRRAWLSIAIAAGILLVAMILRSRVAPFSPYHDPSALEGSFSSTGFFVARAYASVPSAAPGAPRLTGINGLSLGGRRFDYRIQFVDTTGKVTPQGDGVLRVVAAMLDSQPVWRIEHLAHHVDEGQSRTLGETLHVTRRDLRLLRRVVHETPYLRFSHITIAQHFAGDTSVAGKMSTDSNIHRPINRRLPAQFGPYISDAVAPIALVGVPITDQWRANVSVVGWAVRDYDVFTPVTLVVIGSEKYRSFDCWKIRVIAGSHRRVEWVRKSDGIALRSVDDAPPGPLGRREFVLINP